MKKKKFVKVEIKTIVRKYCDEKCRVRTDCDDKAFCELFLSDDLVFDTKEREYLRCEQCLEAEIKA